MHIPDGYLAPAFSLGTGVVTVPAWTVAVRRVKAVLNNRTVPLLAIFSAFSFAIMMFNVPVPGGTTAHGVGGTLIAIVLGPWAAVIGVSVALIIQAVFFGDGGILAIFANCMAMSVVLPFVGYYSYRLIAGRSPVLSARRVWAAGIGAYIGITAGALVVGIELGLQPILFHTADGVPLYSPYTLSQAVPAMLLAHMIGASPVEALITALGMIYLQKRYPEYLTSLRGVVATPDAPTGEAPARPLWQVLTISIAVGIVVLGVIGLVTGGGDPANLFGADWSEVNWSDVVAMLLYTLVLAVILIPIAYFVLPRSIKGIGSAFVAIAVITPLGLIAPGFAYDEGSPEDVNQAFGYVPAGLGQLSGFFSAPLADYNIPLPFFSDESAPLWHAAIGYQVSAIVGFLLLGVVTLGLGYLLRRRKSDDTAEAT